ncbi:P-loop containing nucleoside triphosphate hydrolase protein [Rostrohypoxylon terebratum]|nr:P-loop containing nucleoside triphosphate hydrolase protein [Rostrohypoxylon terebratum]
MRTQLEIKIARRHWRHEEARSINLYKERQFKTKLNAARKGFDREITQLKKIHEEEKQSQARISQEAYDALRTQHKALLSELDQRNRALPGPEENVQDLQREIDEYELRLNQRAQSYQEALEESRLKAQYQDKQLQEARAQLERQTTELESREEIVYRLRQENRDLTKDLGESKRREMEYRELLEEEKRSRYQQTIVEKLETQARISHGLKEELKEKLRIEEYRRRELFGQIQELRGAIRVIWRIRPDNPRDSLVKTPLGELRLTKSDTYEFERIFGPQETNNDVFEEISSFIQPVIDSKKVCIFCYGKSRTGKTYTMSNLDSSLSQLGANGSNDGIIHGVKAMLFAEKERLENIGLSMDIRGCCYEIYNNELWLLNSGGSEKKFISKSTHSVRDPRLKTLKNNYEFEDRVAIGMKTRHFGETKTNSTSSRSHFIISIETRVTLENAHSVVRESVLNLVDLAGSERSRQAGTAGARLQEGNNINTSLAQLGRIFVSLSQGRTPSYNDNILTEFLQPSLQGGCMTIMLLMISFLREDWPATKQTLQLALDAQSARKPAPSNRGMKAASSRGVRK